MTEFYTREDICNLMSPKISKNLIRCMEASGRMPKHITKIDSACVYSKKEIDDWLLTNPCQLRRGRKRTRNISIKTDYGTDVWNTRRSTENIVYTGKMVEIIMFLQPAIRNRKLGNALG